MFQFSMPYIAEKVIDMLYNIIKRGEEGEGKEVSNMEDLLMFANNVQAEGTG